MSFSPFDGVLLDDPRDAVPGGVAIQLHHRVERGLAGRWRRAGLGAAALRERAAACRALLDQGLLPEELRALGRFGLELGHPRDPGSLASLVEHLEAYLEAVGAAGYVEPSEALWRAAGLQSAGGRGFWVERQPEDGALRCGVGDLRPPRLRALCALSELGSVRFPLATERGRGGSSLFGGAEPHLVRQLLPALEEVAAARGLDHLELESPEGWAENPWGEALDGLFRGPLVLEEKAVRTLRRAQPPTEAALWRAAVEQVRAWVEAGIPPRDIALVHPDPGSLAPLLGVWLESEGIPLQRWPGRPLAEGPPWGPLLALVTGQRDRDPARLAEGLGACGAGGDLGPALAELTALLEAEDQAGGDPLASALARLAPRWRTYARERMAFFLEWPQRARPVAAWLRDLEALALRLGLVAEGSLSEDFYAALSVLREVWEGDEGALDLRDLADLLESVLGALRGAEAPGHDNGLRLWAPEALESEWEGSRATLLLDLGEGAWPRAPKAPADLDWARQAALNAALRRRSRAGEGAPDFPPHLQTFLLPECEEGERLPRAFHRSAYGFNRALALTRDSLVALSAQRGEEGDRRAQGPFWQALEGAGTWEAEPGRAATALRWRWEAGQGDPLVRARQAAAVAGLGRRAPEEDRAGFPWTRGLSREQPLSPTRLEALARCPFRVFAEEALGLESWTPGGGTVLRVGRLAHALLEEALRGLEEAPHWPQAFLEARGLADPSESLMTAFLRRTWEAHGEAWMEAAWEAGPEPGEAERARLRLALEGLLPTLGAVLRADLLEAEPTKAEREALGLPEGLAWQRRILGLEMAVEPMELPLPGGGSLWVRGTLDRVEAWQAGDSGFLRIVDYKTSRRAKLQGYGEEEGAFGAHLQLPLYQELLSRRTGRPVTAVLLSLLEASGPVPMMVAPGEAEGRARLLGNLEGLLARAVAGDFPPLPGEHCGRCALSALCGRPVDVEGEPEPEEGP